MSQIVGYQDQKKEFKEPVAPAEMDTSANHLELPGNLLSDPLKNARNGGVGDMDKNKAVQGPPSELPA